MSQEVERKENLEGENKNMPLEESSEHVLKMDVDGEAVKDITENVTKPTEVKTNGEESHSDPLVADDCVGENRGQDLNIVHDKLTTETDLTEQVDEKPVERDSGGELTDTDPNKVSSVDEVVNVPVESGGLPVRDEKTVSVPVDLGQKTSNTETDKEKEDMEEEEEELKPGTLEQPVIVTGKRERKKVERLSTSFSQTGEKRVEVPEGRGCKLGDCPRIDHFLSKTHADDLKPLHRLVYGKPGKETMVRRNLRQFNGFAFEMDSDEFKKKKGMVSKMTLNVLKPICNALDLEKKGTREQVAERVLLFLMEPKDSGKAVPEAKKRKRESTGGKPGRKRAKKTDKKEDDSDDEKSDEGSDHETDSEETEKKEKKDKTTTEQKKKAATPRRQSKKVKKGSAAPTDDDIKATVKEILDGANLEEVTMKTVCKQVYEKFPDHDLIDRKDFIKSTVKALIS